MEEERKKKKKINKLYSNIPFNIEKEGISSDLIIEKYKNMSSELICLICLNIVYDPIMCAKCGGIFCKSCIKQLMKTSNICPNKCILQTKSIDRILHNLLDKFELNCFYKKNGCNKILLYSDFVKHCKECEYSLYKCNSPNCNFISIKKDIISHVEKCPFRIEKCPFCKEVVKYINFESHCNKCLNKKIKCILCNKDLLLKELDSHLKICDMALIECDKCHYKYNRKYYFEKHYLQNDCSKECLINQVEYWKNKYYQLQNNLSYENVEEKIINEDNNNKNVYSLEKIKSKDDLNGIIYSLLDLNKYEENLIAIGNCQIIEFYIIPEFNKKFQLEGHQNYIWDLIYLEEINKELIVSASQDKTIKLWNILNKKCLKTYIGHENWVTSITLAYNFNTDNYYLLSNSYDHKIYIWDLNNEKSIDNIENVYGKIVSVLNNFNKSFIIYGNNNNELCIYDITNKKEKFKMKGHTQLLSCFCDLGEINKNLISTGGDDNSIKIWNLSIEKCICTFKGHTSSVICLVYFNFKNNHLLISGSDDKTLRIWNLNPNSYQCLMVFESESWVKSCIFLKGGLILFHGQTGSIELNKIKKN